MGKRQESAAIRAAKRAIAEIDDLIIHGGRISPVVEAVLTGDTARANELATPPMREHNIVGDLVLHVEQVLPPEFFEGGREAIRAWQAHRGLEQAPKGIDFWLYTFSNRWSPKRRARSP